jgi:hypothetical protein
MVCVLSGLSNLESPLGDVESFVDAPRSDWFFGDRQLPEFATPSDPGCQAAEGNDPFDDFEDDDFDDEFDDDFEEDWEDDLTEDDEFPDTFGGAEPEEEEVAEPDEDSPFADDPDFDEA